MAVQTISQILVFQLTTSRRGRLLSLYFNLISFPFQLTTSRRGRLPKWLTSTVFCVFQLTTSRRGRRYPCKIFTFYILYFNSRPHEEVDFGGSNDKPDISISTHDLTKRSTQALTGKEVYLCYFNSRPHEEVDLIQL